MEKADENTERRGGPSEGGCPRQHRRKDEVYTNQEATEGKREGGGDNIKKQGGGYTIHEASKGRESAILQRGIQIKKLVYRGRRIGDKTES